MHVEECRKRILKKLDFLQLVESAANDNSW